MIRYEIHRLDSTDISNAAKLLVLLHSWHIEFEPEVFGNSKYVEHEAQERRLKEASSKEDIGIFVVVNLDRADLIGISTCYVHNISQSESPLLARKVAMIADLFVIESQRHLGVGVKLLQTTEQWAINQGATEISLSVREKNLNMLAFANKYRYRSAFRWLTKTIN